MPVLPAVSRASKLRVLSFNIKSATGSRGGNMRDEVLSDIASFLQSENPDLVMLQEVDRATRRSHGVDQLQTLSDRTTGSGAHFAPTTRMLGGEYGIGLLLRNGYTFEKAASGEPLILDAALPRRGAFEKRVAIIAAVRAPNGERFTFIGTHLSLTPRVSTQQLAYLREVAQTIQAGQPFGGIRFPPRIVFSGDLNLRAPFVQSVLAPTLNDAFDEVGVGVDDQRRRSNQLGSVDHVYVSPGIDVLGVTVRRPSRTHEARAALNRLLDAHVPERVSDHDALRTDLVLPPS